MSCGKCSQNLQETDEVGCRLCLAKFHFGNCSIKAKTWENLGKEGQDKWTCVKCRNLNRKTSANSSEDQEHTLDQGSQEILTKLDILLGLQGSVSRIESKLTSISQNHEEILKEIREENKALKTKVVALEEKVSKLQSIVKNKEEQVEDLSVRLAEMEQYNRRTNLEIHNFKSNEGEKIEEVIEEIAGKIGVEYKPEDIHKAHRLQPRQDGSDPTIIVQFTSSVKRDIWLKAGKKAKLMEVVSRKKIYFNENLSRYYKVLLAETKRRADLHNYKFVWFNRGKILVRKNENDKNIIVVKCSNDLGKIGLA